jgi:hypothetical protein
MMRDTGNNLTCRDIVFDNLSAHGSSAAGSNPIVYIGGDCYNVNISASMIVGDGGNNNQTPIHIADNAQWITIDSNNLGGGGYSGNLATRINITSAKDLFTIVGNDFENDPVSITWAGLNRASSRATIRANRGNNGLFEYNGPILSVTGTGGGTGATYALLQGDNRSGIVRITAGTSASSGGNVMLDFNATAPNIWNCTASTIEWANVLG